MIRNETHEICSLLKTTEWRVIAALMNELKNDCESLEKRRRSKINFASGNFHLHFFDLSNFFSTFPSPLSPFYSRVVHSIREFTLRNPHESALTHRVDILITSCPFALCETLPYCPLSNAPGFHHLIQNSRDAFPPLITPCAHRFSLFFSSPAFSRFQEKNIPVQRFQCILLVLQIKIINFESSTKYLMN